MFDRQVEHLLCQCAGILLNHQIGGERQGPQMVLAELAHRRNCLLVVDNTYCTPILQNPLLLNADIVIHSTTKYIDGQGRCMGGAIIGNDEELWKEIYSTLRTSGATMSPFNAWVALKGLETLERWGRLARRIDPSGALLPYKLFRFLVQLEIHGARDQRQLTL